MENECRQCGTCCRKGGPALHLEDKPLVMDGHILLKDLFTIRKGEPCFDNVKNKILPATCDIIKIRGKNTLTQCVYWKYTPSTCTIYAHRPVECRALKCWDTRAIELLYDQDRLTRQHVLAEIPDLWELVEHHQQRIDYIYISQLSDLVKNKDAGSADAEEKLLELIRYDQSIRDVVVERLPGNSQILSFLFGRPLFSTISMFQLSLVPTDSGHRLKITDVTPLHQ